MCLNVSCATICSKCANMGSAIWNCEVEDQRNPNEVGGCFVGGTPVWTDKGLVPIEQIKVGDMVLSQPEGKGELTYKRVINTYVYQDKTVNNVVLYNLDEEDYNYIFATANHPFWVEGVGWTSVLNLEAGQYLELNSGARAVITDVFPVLRTPMPGIGWFGGRTEEPGINVSFVNDSISFPDVDGYLDTSAMDGSRDYYLKARVFNIEVEDYHTYYVGEDGVWVGVSSSCRPTIEF